MDRSCARNDTTARQWAFNGSSHIVKRQSAVIPLDQLPIHCDQLSKAVILSGVIIPVAFISSDFIITVTAVRKVGFDSEAQ